MYTDDVCRSLWLWEALVFAQSFIEVVDFFQMCRIHHRYACLAVLGMLQPSLQESF